METIRQFNEAILRRISIAESEGDTFQINQIAANIMTGAMMLIMSALSLLCLLLNELHVFNADPVLMRSAVIFSLIISAPGQILNKRYHGYKPWLREMLLITLLLQTAALSAVLGHNVVLATAIPVVISVRYFDEKLTRIIAGASAVLYLSSTIYCAYNGIVNLNILPLAPGTELTVTDTLRNAVLAAGIDKGAYMRSLLINDYLPRFIAFVVLARACVRIALRSRQYIELQDRVAKKSARIETELSLANEIQHGMLPNIYPAFPEYKELDIYALNRPAKEVGGDFYDFFHVDDDHIAVVMADVSGKGVGAALFMMIAKTIIKNQIQSSPDIVSAITKANLNLCENNSAELFVTVWAGIFEVSTGKLSYVNAGHNPPVICRKGETCEYLRGKSGFVLGAMEGSRYTQVDTELLPGDRILLYTDGVTEDTNAENQLYGEERLLDILNRNLDLSVKDMVNLLIGDLDEFSKGTEQFDDITMLAMMIKD